MARIKAEEVRGFWVEGQLVCPDCILPKELDDLGPTDILTSDEMDEEDFYFCDRNGQRI